MVSGRVVATVMPPPLPYPFNEGLPAELLPLLSFTLELPLHHHLRANSRMIRARQPQRQKTAHAAPADHDVHLGLLEHVTHVQKSSHIGRRQQKAEYRTRIVLAWSLNVKELLLDPVVGPALLDGARLIRFGQFVGHSCNHAVFRGGTLNPYRQSSA